MQPTRSTPEAGHFPTSVPELLGVSVVRSIDFRSNRRSACRPSAFVPANPRVSASSSIERSGCCWLWRPGFGSWQGQFQGQPRRGPRAPSKHYASLRCPVAPESESLRSRSSSSRGPAVVEAGSVAAGSWSDDGMILFARDARGPIYRMAASGGTPVAVTELDETLAETEHMGARFLPGGQRFIYLARSNKPETTISCISVRRIPRRVRSSSIPPGGLDSLRPDTCCSSARRPCWRKR